MHNDCEDKKALAILWNATEPMEDAFFSILPSTAGRSLDHSEQTEGTPLSSACLESSSVLENLHDRIELCIPTHVRRVQWPRK